VNLTDPAIRKDEIARLVRWGGLIKKCAVNTRHVKFGPDVGQLQKGGSDPVKVVKDFLPTIRHVHMKDYDGGEHYLAYTPLGLGKVDVGGICDLLESSGNDLMIMAELDPSKGQPHTPLEAARIKRRPCRSWDTRSGRRDRPVAARHDQLGINRSLEWQRFGQIGKTAPHVHGARAGCGASPGS
jgi:hypothetical protein